MDIFDRSLAKKPRKIAQDLRCGITKSKAGHYHVFAQQTEHGSFMYAKCARISSLGAAKETLSRVKAAIKAASPTNQTDFRKAFQSACFTGEY